MMPLRFNDNKHGWEKLKCICWVILTFLKLFMICFKKYKTIFKELPKLTGMNVTKCLPDVVTSFHPMNHFNKFLALVIFIVLFVVIILLVLKCMLIYLHNTLTQLDEQKAIFTIQLYTSPTITVTPNKSV